MQYTLGGDRGQPFAQHCSCPAILRCSVSLTMAAFLRTLIGVWQIVASIAQGASPCAQSARRQRPCCRPLQRWVYLPKWIWLLQMSLWSRVRALPTLSGPRLFQLQKQTCQKLWPLRALEFEARLLLPSLSSKGNIPRTVRLWRTTWFLPLIHSPWSSVQTASKSCGCFATAWIW